MAEVADERDVEIGWNGGFGEIFGLVDFACTHGPGKLVAWQSENQVADRRMFRFAFGLGMLAVAAHLKIGEGGDVDDVESEA